MTTAREILLKNGGPWFFFWPQFLQRERERECVSRRVSESEEWGSEWQTNKNTNTDTHKRCAVDREIDRLTDFHSLFPPSQFITSGFVVGFFFTESIRIWVTFISAIIDLTTSLISEMDYLIGRIDESHESVKLIENIDDFHCWMKRRQAEEDIMLTL